MIDKITQKLTNKIKMQLPDIDDERAEVINYGLQLIIGEIPKFFIMMLIAHLLGVFKLSLITFLILLPYRSASGGFHLRTHIGCIVSTCTVYCGIAIFSQNIVMSSLAKYLVILAVAVHGAIFIKLYAPADTEWVPIISKELRKRKRILSYVFFAVGLLVATFIQDSTISNIIIFGYLVQSLMISRVAYKLTNNKYRT